MFFAISSIATTAIVGTFVIVARATVGTVFHARTILKSGLILCETVSVTVEIIVLASLSTILEVKNFVVMTNGILSLIADLSIL